MDNAVTVVIPNYNGLKFMDTCMEALKTQTFRRFKVLVIDNGSTDGSVEWLKERGIDTIFLPENIGFSGAVNIGIKASATPYVLLLNNDTRVDSYFVAEMLRAIERSPRIFSVSSKMIQMSRPDQMDDAGDMYSVLGWAFQRGVGRDVRKYRRSRRVFSACAGAAIYRRAVFEEIGYFDERHFAYLEDMDVGYRARLYGYDNIYCPDALVWHVGSGTSGSKYNPFKVRLAARNNIYLIYKNMPAWQMAVNAVPIAAGMFVKYLFFKRLGYEKEYVDGLREGVKTAHSLDRAVRKRRDWKQELSVELELIAGTCLYIYEFAARQITKLK